MTDERKPTGKSVIKLSRAFLEYADSLPEPGGSMLAQSTLYPPGPAVTKVVRYLPEGEGLDSSDPVSLFDAYDRTAFGRLREKYTGDPLKWGPRINMIRLRLARWLLWRDRIHFDSIDYEEALQEFDEVIGFAVRLDVYDKYGV